MNKTNYIILSFSTLLAGIIFLAYQEGFIVVRTPREVWTEIHVPRNEKRAVKLFFWKQQSWHHETDEIIWSEQKAVALEYLINRWLALLDEEEVSTKKTSLQTVILIANEQEACISFTRNPFSSQEITFQKWMWVEGLLKTVRENMPDIKRVRFLVQHKPLKDLHLDFVNPWPTHGFLNN